MTIAKLFALHANAKKHAISCQFNLFYNSVKKPENKEWFKYNEQSQQKSKHTKNIKPLKL